MNKSKLSIGLMAGLLSVGVLSGCKNKDVKSSKDGVLLTYVDENGKKQTITAEGLLDEYYNDSSKYQSIYDTIYSIVVRNYFNYEEVIHVEGKDDVHLGKTQMEQINIDAEEKALDDEDTAKERADANDTKYKDEFQKILDERGVKDRDALVKKYVEELQKETFDKNFYKYHIEDIKQGDLAEEGKIVKYKQGNNAGHKFWTGYFEDQLPYHISHILVKIEDSASTNYSNGTISKDNAEKLYKTVKALADGKDSFNTIARQYSEDTSDMVSGDLGIMDYATNFVPEFKLGVYAYENLVKKADGISSSRISMGSENDTKSFAYLLKEASKDAFGDESLPLIPFSVFEELNYYADQDKDVNNKPVIEDSTLVLPRNIIFNKYLNRHSFAFISNATETGSETLGFHKFTEEDGIDSLKNETLLAVKTNNEWTPIITVRAGSDYQGIHFIVINRSAFDSTRNGVKMSDYYTTFYPEQADYPKVGTKKTYVNFSSTDVSKTKPRAEEFESKLKSYDSDKLGKFIFRKYFEMEGLSFTEANAKLATALDKWIDRGLEKKDRDEEESWKKTWNSYLDTLKRQNDERKKLMPQACKIGYKYANSEIKLDLETKLPGDTVPLVTRMYQMACTNDGCEIASVEDFLAELKKVGEKEVIETLTDLYKVEGGYCNDGKAHQ